MKAANWIDRVRSAKGLPSDYAAAKALQITRHAVSNYRMREGLLDEDVSVRVAQLLGIDPAIVLTDQAMERAKNADARSAWSAILQRLGGVAAGFLLAVGVSTAPSPAQAGLNISFGASTGMHIVSSTTPARRRRENPIAAARRAYANMARILARRVCAAPA